MPKTLSRFQTPEEATKFDTFSRQNYLTVLSATTTKGCNCDPYKQVYTYERWRGQGFQVQRGEKALCKILTFLPVKDKDTNRIRTIPRHCSVFCKCQVKEIS